MTYPLATAPITPAVLEAANARAERWRQRYEQAKIDSRAEGIHDALTDARKIVSQYLASAEQWRYDRVLWAFAIMLGEIPEDSPEPPSPSDPNYEETYGGLR